MIVVVPKVVFPAKKTKFPLAVIFFTVNVPLISLFVAVNFPFTFASPATYNLLVASASAPIPMFPFFTFSALDISETPDSSGCV